jgi:hypothetical protein
MLRQLVVGDRLLEKFENFGNRLVQVDLLGFI